MVLLAEFLNLFQLGLVLVYLTRFLMMMADLALASLLDQLISDAARLLVIIKFDYGGLTGFAFLLTPLLLF